MSPPPPQHRIWTVVLLTSIGWGTGGVMTRAAFEAKLASRDRFVARVAREPKIFVLGDAGEFAELAENRAA